MLEEPTTSRSSPGVCVDPGASWGLDLDPRVRSEPDSALEALRYAPPRSARQRCAPGFQGRPITGCDPQTPVGRARGRQALPQPLTGTGNSNCRGTAKVVDAGQQGSLEELRSCDALVSSELLAVESLRTIDRLRLQGALSIDEAASGRAAVTDWLEAVDLVLLQRPILARASDPFPVPLGTLDGLHLATALVWHERTGKAVVLATHDEGLALAARAFGIEVLGVAERP